MLSVRRISSIETIEVEIPYKYERDEFHFYPIGDCHLGTIECSENDLKKELDTCLNDRYGFMLGMGDFCECITKNDPRFDSRNLADWVSKDNIVESQREKVVKLFKPLADAHKIIGLLTGNHEEEIHLRHDNDITRNICADLGVRYAGYQCFVALQFTRRGREKRHNTYIWHAWHGAGAAQSEGARTMRLMRLVSDIEADIYTMGHLHGAITTYTPDRLNYNIRTHKIESTKVIATTTGSWVKSFLQSTEERPTNSGYGERKGYKPARIGCPVIKINPRRRIVEVVV